VPLSRYGPHQGHPIQRSGYPTITPDELRAAADILDRGLDERLNPESVKWNPKFAGCDIPFDLKELAESIISEG
jgi:hypothetical protein